MLMVNHLVGFGAVNSVSAPFSAVGVDWSGSSQYLVRGADFTGSTNGAQGIFSVFFRVDGGSGGYRHIFIDNYTHLRLTDTNTLAFFVGDGSSSFSATALGAINDSGWHHFCASWDTNFSAGNKILHMYLDNLYCRGTVTDANAAFTIDYTQTDHYISRHITATEFWNGGLFGFYFAPNQFLDLSVASNRAKFFDGQYPVNLGSTGATPTGTAPIVYLQGTSAAPHVNSGTGGDFTLTGSPTSAGTVVVTPTESATADPYWDAVSALLHCNGSDGSTTITDAKGHTFTASGTAEIDTAQSVFGGASLFLSSGSTGYVSSAAGAHWNFGTGDFTVEFRVRMTAVSATRHFLGITSASNNASWSIWWQSNTLYLTTSAGAHDRSVSWTPSANVWYAIAVVKRNCKIYFFVNELLLGSVDDTNSWGTSTDALYIGKEVARNNNAQLEGWMDEIRITKGAGRYITSYTVATAAFPETQATTDPEFANVTALLHFDGSNGSTTFTDEKGSTWTRSGSGTISTAQSVFGGASYENGTYITTNNASATNVGSGDLTIEFAIRASAVTGVNLFDFNDGADEPQLSGALSGGTLRFSLYQSGAFRAQAVGSTSLSTATWYYVRMIKQGSSYTIYLGTTQGGIYSYEGTASYATAMSNPDELYIGANRVGGGPYGGFIDEFRITKGVRTGVVPASAFPNS